MNAITHKAIRAIPGPLRRALAAAVGRWIARLPEDVAANLAARWLPPAVLRNKRYFHLWEARGYHVTPVHYFEPIPDTRALPETLWGDPERFARGVDFRLADQLRRLREFRASFGAEYNAFPRQPPAEGFEYYSDQRSFYAVDAEVLYCMIRRYRPRRVLEIGSGISSRVAASALATNRREHAGEPGRLICVEPYPDEHLLRGQAEGRLELRATPVQEEPLETFEELRAGDILFIDSTHVARIGGDVEFLFLMVMPRLRPGVLVHVHDVFLPAEFRRDWVLEGKLFWNEQYLLHAFLQCNREWEVLWAASCLHRRHPDALREAFPVYDPAAHWPTSFWMRRVEPPENAAPAPAGGGA